MRKKKPRWRSKLPKPALYQSGKHSADCRDGNPGGTFSWLESYTRGMGINSGRCFSSVFFVLLNAFRTRVDIASRAFTCARAEEDAVQPTSTKLARLSETASPTRDSLYIETLISAINPPTNDDLTRPQASEGR